MPTDRVHLPDFWKLTWSDVDPATRPPVDPAAVADLVRTVSPAAEVPPADTDPRLVDFWYDRMTEALVERLGPWVVGWWYTVAMGDDGVPAWRGERPPVTTPAETLARLAAAVVAWHWLLVELATDARGRFAGVTPRYAVDGPPAWQAVWGNGRHAHYPGLRDYPRGPLSARELGWADLDPTGRDFDPATVPAVVRELLAASGIPAPGVDWRLRELWSEGLTIGLVDRYGPWVSGWRWSVGEGDLDGGPVGSWCCFAHSVTTPEATATVVAEAVLEWHDWLVELADRFDRFLPLPPGDLDGWERAVAHLVTAVGDRTQYESGWYGCCRTVLGWFLDAAGVGGDRQELLHHAIGGRFKSWVEPPRQVVEAVAERVAGRVAGG